MAQLEHRGTAAAEEHRPLLARVCNVLRLQKKLETLRIVLPIFKVSEVERIEPLLLVVIVNG